MTQNCKPVSIDEVVKFFEDEIDGTGKHDGYPRNEGFINSIRLWNSAKHCELTESEFLHLIIPDTPQIHLKDKQLGDVKGDDSIFVLNKYHKKLEEGDILPSLIIREVLPVDIKNSSFYIEDGAHKALAYKKFFLENPYRPVKTFIGCW